MKKNTKGTLAESIAAVLSVVPSIDPEDEEATAKLIENAAEDESEDELLLSKFRKQNIDLLEDIDRRYAGKKGSRIDYKSSDDVEESEDEQSGEINSGKRKTFDNDTDNTSEDENNYEDSEDGSDVDSDKYESVETSTFKHMKDPDTSGQLQKGICIKNQLSLWETFLEMRIQLQKCLISSNKMPQYNSFVEFNKNPEFEKKCSDTKKVVRGVLDKLLELQNLSISKYPETKNVFKQEKVKIEDDENEEIPSDTEEEFSESEQEIIIPKKKLKLSEYESNISNMHNKYIPFRNSVIQKWNNKTQIISGKNVSGHSVINQIEHNLQDHDKLIKRTQIKRSEYKILGTEVQPINQEDVLRFVEEHNIEIFDDDDFYHQLLRELIEVKSADVTDPVQLGRQWIQLQSLRSKMKRKIDTKATKGRKIRYAVHSKLVNFMAPIDDNNYTDDAKTELFNSLFGKTQAINV